MRLSIRRPNFLFKNKTESSRLSLKSSDAVWQKSKKSEARIIAKYVLLVAFSSEDVYQDGHLWHSLEKEIGRYAHMQKHSSNRLDKSFNAY